MDNQEVEIKITADGSEVDKEMKKVSKSVTKMGKDVEKSADKAEDSFDGLEKELKNVSKELRNLSKNINLSGLTKSFDKAMNDITKSVSKAVNSIQKQLQQALNVQGNVEIDTKTTTDTSSSVSSSMMDGAVSSLLTGGAIGSQIAKALADSLKQTEKPLKEIPKTFEKNMTQSITNVGNVLTSVIDTLKSFGLGFDDGSTIFSIFENVESIEDFKGTLLSMINTYNGSIEQVEIRLEKNKQLVADLINELAVAEQHNKAFGTNVDVSHITQQMERWTSTIQFQEQMLDSLKKELQEFCQVNYVLDLNQVQEELDELFATFEETPTKLNAEAIVNQFKKIKTEMDLLQLDSSFLTEMLSQWEQVRTCSMSVDQFSNSLRNTKQSLDGMLSSSRQYVNEQIQLTLSQRQAKTTTEQLSQAQIKQRQTIEQSKNQIKGFGKEVINAYKGIKPHIASMITKVKEWGKSHLSVSKQIKSANKGLSKSFKSLATSVLPFLTLIGAFNLLKTSVTDSMDAIETSNMYMAVFGKNASDMDKFINEVNKTMGLSIGQTKEFTAIVGQMGLAMGMSSQDAMDMSQSMAKMAGDISSFYNADIVQVQEDLRSALSGSMETMDKYGVVLRENTIKQYAYKEGIARTGAELTNSQRAMATTALIYKQLGQANGDMAKTMDTPAGRARQLTVAFQQLKTALGGVVLPIWNAIMPGLTALANALTSVLNTVASVVNGILSLFGLGLKSSGASGIINEAQNLGTSLDSAGGGAGDIADGLSDGAKSAKDIVKSLSLMPLDEINNLNSPDKGSSGGSGGNGGSGGGGSTPDLGSLEDVYEVVEQGESVFDSISDKAQAFVDGFKEVWSKIVLGFAPYKQDILDEWNLLKLNLQILGEEIVNFFTSCWKNGGSDIAIHLGSLSATITETFLSVCNTVVEAVTDLFKHLNPNNNGHVQSFITSFDNMILAIKRFVGKFDEWLQVLKDNGGQEFLNNCADIAFILGTTIVDAVTDAIEAFTGFLSEDDNKRVKDFGGVLETISGALKDISKWVQDNIGWLSVLAGAVTGLIAGIKLAPAVITAVVTAFQGWGWIVGIFETIASACTWLWTVVLAPLGSAIMTGLGAIASAFGISVGGVVAIIVGVIAAGVLLWKNWDTIVEKGKAMCEGISKWWDKTWKDICKWCQKISKDSKKKWDEIVQGIIDKCKEIWDGVVGWFKDIVSFFTGGWKDSKKETDKGWDNIEKSIDSGAKDAIKNLEVKMSSVAPNISKVWENVKSGVSSAWSNISSTLGSWATQTKDTAKDKLSGVVSNVQGIWNNVTSGVSSAWSNIKSNASSLATQTKDTIRNNLSGVTSNVSTIWSNVQSGASTGWSNIKSTLSSSVSNAKNQISSSLDGAKGSVSSIWSNINSGVQTGWNTIKSTLNSYVSTARSQIGVSLDGAKTTVSNIWSSIKTGVGTAWSGIKTAVSGKVNEVKNTITGMKTSLPQPSVSWSSIKTSAQNAINSVKSVVTGFTASLPKPSISWASSIKTSVQTAIDNVKKCFSFSWSLPKPKLPKFTPNYTTIAGVKIPTSFSITWHRKGGILPDGSNMIFGMNGNSLMAGGERGTGGEAILPLNTLWNEMATQFNKQTEQIAKLTTNNNQQQSQQPTTIVLQLDGRELARGTVSNMSQLARVGQLNLDFL